MTHCYNTGMTAQTIIFIMMRMDLFERSIDSYSPPTLVKHEEYVHTTVWYGIESINRIPAESVRSEGISNIISERLITALKY